VLPLKLADSLALRDVEILVLNDYESLSDVLMLADSLLLILVLTDNESLIDVLVLVDSLMLADVDSLLDVLALVESLLLTLVLPL
jgi:hypothetical protein